MAPTRIYVKPVLELLKACAVKGMAHITGGGLVGNIPRVLPDNVCARLERSRWPSLPIFEWLQREGGIDDGEMARTFNCGLGMVLVVARDEARAAIEALARSGVPAYEVGSIVARGGDGAQAIVA
jgi:phosphoribosylformylglycinamidine cyclo-ligase